MVKRIATNHNPEKIILTDYAIAVRYPEEPFEPTLEEAKEAFEIAKKIRNFVSSKIARLRNI
jgi:hypothetical protein